MSFAEAAVQTEATLRKSFFLARKIARQLRFTLGEFTREGKRRELVRLAIWHAEAASVAGFLQAEFRAAGIKVPSNAVDESQAERLALLDLFDKGGSASDELSTWSRTRRAQEMAGIVALCGAMPLRLSFDRSDAVWELVGDVTDAELRSHAPHRRPKPPGESGRDKAKPQDQDEDDSSSATCGDEEVDAAAAGPSEEEGPSVGPEGHTPSEGQSALVNLLHDSSAAGRLVLLPGVIDAHGRVATVYGVPIESEQAIPFACIELVERSNLPADLLAAIAAIADVCRD